MANSIENRNAIAAWGRKVKIAGKEAEKENLQKQLNKLLSVAPTEEAMKQASELYKSIADLNKKIGTMKSRGKKQQD